MIGIDLFSGAGGMSLGAAQAGIDINLVVERDPGAAATYGHNHPYVDIFNDDIIKLTNRKLKTLVPRRREIVVFGGPPCQGFSYSNSRTRTKRNVENWLFLEFLRVVRILSPEFVVFENVKGIIDTAKGIFLEELANRMTDLGYSITHGILNAKDFGVPQDRSRFFLLANLDTTPLKMPSANTEKPITVAEAIGDLPKLTNGASFDLLRYRCPAKSSFAKRMRRRKQLSTNHHVTRNAPYVVRRYAHIPQGGNWENIPSRLMRNYKDRSRCHTGIYHRLRKHAPSVVIGNYRKNMLIHPEQDRGLSVREAARLQSFPDSFKFCGSIGFQQQQVGNAVPPLLAESVFRAVIHQM